MSEDRRKLGFNAGDFLHVIEIALVVFAMGKGYQELQEYGRLAQQSASKLDRIEHYLSSKDSAYWQKTGQQ